MSKSIKLEGDNYIDSSGIILNFAGRRLNLKQLFSGRTYSDQQTLRINLSTLGITVKPIILFYSIPNGASADFTPSIALIPIGYGANNTTVPLILGGNQITNISCDNSILSVTVKNRYQYYGFLLLG